MFNDLGPGSFLAFGEVMCILAAGVYCALWYVGKQTPKHIGKRVPGIWVSVEYDSKFSFEITPVTLFEMEWFRYVRF